MWKKYFKAPFKNVYNIYIFDADGHPVANFISTFDEDSGNRLVDTINGNYKPTDRHNITLSEKKDRIIMDNKPILLIRGWGYLTGVGGCKLKAEAAIEVQNSLAEYICEQLNK